PGLEATFRLSSGESAPELERKDLAGRWTVGALVVSRAGSQLSAGEPRSDHLGHGSRAGGSRAGGHGCRSSWSLTTVAPSSPGRRPRRRRQPTRYAVGSRL